MFFCFLTNGLRRRKLHVSSNPKPMTQTSTQTEFLPASCRWCKGSRNDFAEWTAEGGPNGAQLPVSTDGLFPRYQGKACDGTSLSGRMSVNLGGTAEVSDFCPKGTYWKGPCGMKVFFVSHFPEGPQL